MSNEQKDKIADLRSVDVFQNLEEHGATVDEEGLVRRDSAAVLAYEGEVGEALGPEKVVEGRRQALVPIWQFLQIEDVFHLHAASHFSAEFLEEKLSLSHRENAPTEIYKNDILANK